MPDLAYWGRLAARLAAEAGIIVALAAGIAACWRPGFGRRWLWLGAVFMIASVSIGEVAGVGNLLEARRARSIATGSYRVHVTVVDEPRESSRDWVPASATEEVRTPAKSAVWWPGWMWMGGTAVLCVWPIVARVGLGWRDRRGRPADRATAESVGRLARMLRLERIEVRAWSGCRCPMAFGLRRPRIVVPDDFEARFEESQREAMLVHELAHLAAKDGWWMSLAGVLCAVAWWFPGVWWLRRRLRSDLERAADSASALLPGGPTALAEALVSLGRDWAGLGSTRGLAAAGNGLRSELGRRVAMLVASAPTWRRPSGRGGLIALVAATLLALVVMGLAGGRDGSAFLGSLILAQVRAEGPEASLSAGPAVDASTDSTTDSNGTNPSRSTTGTRDREPMVDEGGADRAVTRLEEAPKADLAGLEARERASSTQALTGRLTSPSSVDSVPAPAQTNPPPPRLLTRVFRIDGVRMIERVAKELGRSEAPAAGVDLPDRGPVQEMMREYFAKLGVSLLPPNAIFLNDRLGLLMVRVTEGEIGRIEEAVERLDVGRREVESSAPKVRLEVKVLEVPEQAGEDLGLDWLFADAIARETPPKWEQPTGDLPGAQSPGARNIRIERGRLEARSVILTEAQVSALLKRLESRGGIELLSPPSVETRSGSQAQVQVQELRRIVTGVDARDAVGTNAAQVIYHTEEMAFGPMVNVWPTFEDGAWRLTVTGRQTDFIGYDDPRKSVVQGPDPKAEPLSYQLPLPLLRVREVLGDGRLEAGETLMLRGPVAETISRTRRGWFRSSKLETEKRRCYVLLTPSSVP